MSNTERHPSLQFLQFNRIESSLKPSNPETTCPPPQTSPQTPLQAHPHPLAIERSATEAEWKAELTQYVETLTRHQLLHPEVLLKLEGPRKNSIALFLCELAKKTVPMNVEPSLLLKDFISPTRTPSEHEALKTFFTQIAWVQVSKALLLKSWKALKSDDLKNLTVALEKTLRPFIHLKSATFQLIQKNFYSWHTLSESSQQQLFEILQKIPTSTPSESLSVRNWLFDQVSKASAKMLNEPSRYRSDFYAPFWKSFEKNLLNKTRVQQNKLLDLPTYAFSPSLRDGALFENAPEGLQWVGFEPLSFELIFSEIRILWEKPIAPPLWTKGCGLELNMETQPSLMVTDSGKMNVIRQIDQIQSCEVAWITEEVLFRTQGRSLASQNLRKFVDQHPLLKKLKSPLASRGMYQACLTMHQLRQGGLLIWAREELLQEESGKALLHYYLNECQLLAILDFTTLQQDFTQPQNSSCSKKLPKAIYLFKKETSIEERKNHRPVLIKAFGSLKTQEDLDLLMDRALQNVAKPEIVFPSEPFHLTSRLSPVHQHEWETHWFNPIDNQWVEEIEALKRTSELMGKWAIIKPITLSEAEQIPVSETQLGFYLWVGGQAQSPEILTASAQHIPLHLKTSSQKQSTTLFWVTPSHPHHELPLKYFLKSHFVRDWLNYSAERKKGLWNLKESDLKSIPVPASLGIVLNEPLEHQTEDYFFQHLFGKNKNLYQHYNSIAIEPSQSLKVLSEQFDSQPHLKGWVFKKAAEAMHFIETSQSQLSHLVISSQLLTPDEASSQDGSNFQGELDWAEFIKYFIAPKDLLPFDQSPYLKFHTSIPQQLPIENVASIQIPSAGILLVHPRGVTHPILIHHPWMKEYVLKCIKSLLRERGDLTFFELIKLILIPKNPEQVEIMGKQVLQSVVQDRLRKKELHHLMNVCLSETTPHSSSINLLQ